MTRMYSVFLSAFMVNGTDKQEHTSCNQDEQRDTESE